MNVLLLVWQIIARLGRLFRAYAPALLALSVLFFAVLELNALHSSMNAGGGRTARAAISCRTICIFYRPRHVLMTMVPPPPP
jgi:hypothetical protein